MNQSLHAKATSARLSEQVPESNSSGRLLHACWRLAARLSELRSLKRAQRREQKKVRLQARL
jgi:hypothetical protein